MRKIFTILSICMFTANYCFAAGMELSDLIETAYDNFCQKLEGGEQKGFPAFFYWSIIASIDVF